MNFGNMGNPQHNMALYDALGENCFINMAYLVAFQMYGTVVAGKFVDYCKKNQFKGGDIQIIHDFLVSVGNTINLVAIHDVRQVRQEMMMKCNQTLKGQPWFNLLIKIMKQTKQILVSCNNNVPAPASRWDTILNIFMTSYKNKIFFNQSLFGGKKKNF
mgnify:CR=1 FL=1